MARATYLHTTRVVSCVFQGDHVMLTSYEARHPYTAWDRVWNASIILDDSFWNTCPAIAAYMGLENAKASVKVTSVWGMRM